MNKTIILPVIVSFVVAGAAGFYAGKTYQAKQAPAFAGRGQFAGRGAGGQGGPNQMNFRPVNGEIIASDSGSITVKATDGTSRIIVLSDKTDIVSSTTAEKTALTVGTKVAAFGSTNSDGSVTASSVQINPMMRPERPAGN